MQLSKIEEEVAEWSRRNFGAQVSKTTGQELGSLAPLLGLGEELGELEEARSKGDLFLLRDAVGDCFIYLLDYCSREELSFESLWNSSIIMTGPKIYLHLYGKLLHVVLKRHQGIRGYDNDAKFLHEHTMLLRWIIGELKQEVDAPEDLLQKVWQEVKERDWKKNPEGADKLKEKMNSALSQAQENKS